MPDEQLPSAVNISKRYTALISLVLGAIGYFVLPFLQSKGFLAFLPALSGLDEYAAFYHLFGAAVGLLMPSIIAIIWRGLNLLRPRPGAKAFDEDDRQEMKKAFEIDRRMLSIAMVPSHPATAKAAKNSAHLELGDATLVLPKRSQILLKKFVGAPRSRSRAKKQLTAALQKDILIVTGEPGAGKSVLVQELHSTLSKGVEEGSHSLVPFIVLARDLTLELLREARGSDSPMSTFLKRYYERRLAVATDAGLVKLYNLVAERWQNLDAIVIVDALDEIAQRSKYEEIQRILSEMILSDLKHGGKCVHRYVLSCRVDEDLGIFPNAYSIVLRGLSDAERNRFCESLISRSGLDREGMRMLQEVIDMGRVSPSHVFRRNPYFLSLLLRHLRDDEDRVKDQVIDFDLLMRKYLEREAGRPYALIGKRQSVTAEERRALFNELEKISRSSLQYLAYCSASTNKIGALYDETELNFKLLAGFSSEINSPLPEQLSAGPWKDLHLLLEVLANQERTSAITNAQLHELDLSSCLHENDIRLLDSLSLQLQSVGNGEALVFSAMGTIPYRSSIETAAWYRKLAELFARLVPWEETDKHARLAFLLFLRGIVAAHALRIVVINLTDQSITVRLRHRRLAEYYAASYIRNCWNVVHVSLRFSPWLAPVLNLTCAIEGPKCSALSWLVARVGDAPWRPFYEWRNAVEAAVEAAFFSHPSSEYARAVSRLTATIVTTLQTRGSRVRVQSSSISSRSKHMPTYAAADAIDPVTEIVLLRSLESIGRLDKVLKGPVIREGVRLGFSSYVECLPIEWLAAILRPRDAVERLAGKVFSLRSTILIIRRLIRKPGSVFSSYGGGRRRSEWKFLIPITLATILGEIAMLSVSTAVVAGLFYLIVGRLAGSGPEIHTATIVIATIAGASFLIVRSLAWLRSPIRAAEWSPWDKLPRVVQQLWRLYRTASRELPLVVRGWRSTRKRALSLHAKLIFRKFLFGIGSVGIATSVILLVTWLWPEKAVVSRPVPCPGIATTWNRLWSKYGAITDGPQLENVQQQFRRDIEAFKKSNREHCGNKDNLDGYWVLSEDQLVDAIAYKNPALAAISGTALELQDDEYGRFQAAKAEPIVQSTVSFVISISAVYHRWELLYRMRQIKEIRRRVIDARRDGHGLSPTSAQAVLGTAWDDLVKKMGMPTAAIASSNRAIDILEQRIHTSQTALEALDQQSRRGYINSSIAVLGLGFLWMVALSMLSRIRDRKSVKRMNAERSVTKLCSILQDPLYSEMVRGHALHRIDFLGVSERSELDAIEKAVHMLLLRPLSTDRGLGIRAARLADVLGSRLRHRTIIDVPMEKQRRSMAMARSSQE